MPENCLPGQATPKPVRQRSQGSTRTNILSRKLIPDVVTGYPLYDCNGEDSSNFYLVQPFAADNLITNPTFYKNLEGWTVNNAKMLRTNEWSYDSGFSVRVSGSGDITTADRREYIQSEVFDYAIDDTYVFSAHLYIPQVWDVVDPSTGTISIVEVDALLNETEVYSEKITKRQKWIRLEVSKRISDTADRVFVRINLRSQDQQEIQPPHDATGFFNLAHEYLYADMLQFERGIEATTPFHGDTQVCKDCNTGCDSNDYDWYGEAHNSASHRSECARDGGKLLCLSEEFGFQMLSHTGHGAPPVRDISYPLANRPGELYQKTAIDARILTFTGAVCESTLHALECSIFGLQNAIFPDSCYCDGRFLIVYRHENCNDRLCDPERDLALCVTYIGGLEGFRDNLYQQRLTLQFKAHDPFWFSWPGHSSQAMATRKVVKSPNVVKINPDGTTQKVPVTQGSDIQTAACLGSGSLLIGGEFSRVLNDGNPESNDGCSTCVDNLAILDCDTWCPTGTNQFSSGAVTSSVIDANGNVIIGGKFSGGIGIVYSDGSYGHFSGYPNGEPNAIAAPFWAQVVVATDDGVYIQTNDGNWYLHGSNGPVNDIAIAPNGDVIAVGDFTVIGGVSTQRIARYNLFDYDTPQWDAFDTGFDDSVNAVAVDQDNGTIYVGGEFLNTVPSSNDTCVTVEDTTQISTCASQELQITQKSGDIYTFTLRMGNIIARETMRNCAGFIRITASNSCGTKYNFLFGNLNSTFVSADTLVRDDDEPLYTITYDVDTSYSLTIGDCTTSNLSFVNELEASNDFIKFLSPLELPAGTGFDDTLGSIELGCVSLTTVDTPDSTSIKHIAQIKNNVISNMNDGVDMIPTVLTINRCTKELWIGGISDGGSDGLLIWNGLSYRSYGDIGIGDAVDINDIVYCNDNSMIIVYDGNSPVSALPGATDIPYYGSAAVWPELVVHGPANIESISDGKNDLWNGCLIVECGEIVTYDFKNGSISSNFRDSLGRFGFVGSKMSQCLSPRCENDWKLYMSDVDADTNATLVWRDSHVGIEALCCNERAIAEPTNFYISCCPTVEYTDSQPTSEWCLDVGYPVGSLVLDYGCACPSLFVSIDDSCPGDCCYFSDQCSEGILDEDGNCLCPDDAALTTDCD